MELLDALLQRSLIVTLAIAGACIATLGSFLGGRLQRIDPRLPRLVIRTGYALAWSSVVLFVIAGFRAAYV